jgi:hypothetical protein
MTPLIVLSSEPQNYIIRKKLRALSKNKHTQNCSDTATECVSLSGR